MTTPSEYAKNATAALHEVLGISPGDFDVKGTATVIERAIRSATRDRETKARRRFNEAQAAGRERLQRLLSASPAVIYSFKATGDFAPTFVSENIVDVFGYAPAEYLEDASFWRDRVHPDDLARVRKGNIHILPEWSALSRISLSPQEWLLERYQLLGER